MSPVLLPLAERYLAFHSEVFSSLEEKLPPLNGIGTMAEMDLQSLWYAGEFGGHFTSTDGQNVVVKDWGIWNASAGPDFRQCVVEVDGQRLKGDIELDPDLRDWERHAHGANPDYDNVVLHLFLHQPEAERYFTRTVSHRAVPQVKLTDDLLLHTGLQRPSRQAAARLGRCAAPLAEMPAAAVRSLLESSAQYRLQRKSQRLHQWSAAHGREQAIFQALAQAMGYRQNTVPFLMVTQRLPLKRLLKASAAEREALLFGVSGFLESVVFDETREDTRGYLRGLWENWWRLRDEFSRWHQPTQRLRWRVAGTRPGNHPQRRLATLAAILDQWSLIAAPLREATRWSAQAWKASLEPLSHPYWDQHYTLLAEPAARPIALLGKTRVQEILANVVYPLLVPERGALWHEYLDLPALLDNEKVNRAALRLFGLSPHAKDFQRKLHHQQGLLQLYEDFCLEDDSGCEDCPFPERLAQWSS